jgi:hypothetical protein
MAFDNKSRARGTHFRRNVLRRLRRGLAVLVLTVPQGQGSPASYRDASLPIDQRVSNLPKQMTLEEKVDQLVGGRIRKYLEDPESKEAFEKLQQLSDLNATATARDRARIYNAAQKGLVERTRLGIPNLFRGEPLHLPTGYRRRIPCEARIAGCRLGSSKV